MLLSHATQFRISRWLLGAGLLLASPAPVSASSPPRMLDAGDGLFLLSTRGQAIVREGPERQETLELPNQASLRRLARTRDGWIATGTVVTPGGYELFLLRSSDGRRKTAEIPPNPRNVPLRFWPVPLLEDGGFAGLAWIEGESRERTLVKASFWDGAEWSAEELVAPVGADEQLALAGASLNDGSWLLVWTAFDGEDDETVWSRRDRHGWSPPRRIHSDNHTPDITPAVVATGERGALAAWSRSDGRHYRLRIASFADGEWSDSGYVGGDGSLYPTLFPTDQGARLLHRTVSPATWTVLDLDAGGRPLRSAAVETEARLRPALALSDDGAVFEWPDPTGGLEAYRAGVAWRAVR